jgi:TrmH family RNA methyltransferase
MEAQRYRHIFQSVGDKEDNESHTHTMIHQRLSPAQAKLIRSLRLKKHRQRTGYFVVEGDKSVRSLLKSHSKVRLLVGTQEFLQTIDATTLEKVTSITQTDKATLTSLSTLTQNNTVLAMTHLPQHGGEDPPQNTWGLVLDGIRDPGNMGTILRVADWFHLPALICSSDTVDAYNSKAIQASMGSFTRIPVYYTAHLGQWLGRTPWPIFGTFPEGKSMYDTQIPSPSLIVIGNESHGIRDNLLIHLREKISIPRYGSAASLNAAVAAAIVCSHWKHQASYHIGI